MIQQCGFCNKQMEKIEHANKEMFDVFLCEGCQPNYTTRYRQLFYKGEFEVLATTIRIDEYFVVLNHSFNFTSRRTNYTKIYKKIIGELNDSLDLEPLTWGPDLPVFDLDFILSLPLHDVAACRQKLSIYTTFS
jgi:hypothetical protein